MEENKHEEMPMDQPGSADQIGKEAPETTQEAAAVPESQAPKTEVSHVTQAADQVIQNVSGLLVGHEDLVELLLAGLFVGGHVLLEGLPGIAKTLTAKLLARSLDSAFSRIQFTPDLMPADITGTSVYNVKSGEFEFRKGPIFSNIVLIDEVNRAPAKTQAALMEVMEERQVTYDGHTYPFSPPFMVIATQNPIEQEGTYALPEAQLDRFIFRVKVGYPDLQGEIRILETFQTDFNKRNTEELKPVISKEQIMAASRTVEQVHMRREILEYIARIVNNTRNNADLFMGASPRASLAMLQTSKAIAAIRGRDFVTPDDVKTVCYPVLNHRLILSHEREMEGSTVEDVIRDILEQIEVPR